MWQCKGCESAVQSRSDLLAHYKLHHPHFGRTTNYPCTYTDCPCTFKTWNALIVHQSRVHGTQLGQTLDQLNTFSCHLCSCSNLPNEREYFIHVNTHLRKNEVVSCMFTGCTFQTSVYGTFKSHKSRLHNPHTLADFRPEIVRRTAVPLPPSSSDLGVTEGVEEDLPPVEQAVPHSPVPNTLQKELAAALLKLEHLVLVPGTAIDDFLQNLHFLLTTASASLFRGSLNAILESHNLQIDDSVVTEIVTAAISSPVHQAIEKGGSLSTTYQRKVFYKKEFDVVEPVTYTLDHKKKRTFQYVPLLKSLQNTLNCQAILDKVIDNHRGQQESQLEPLFELRAPEDGVYFRSNAFLNSDELRLSLRLFVDDYETCNVLGTSRNKHKLCGIYWVLGNLPPGSHSSLSSIFLTVLCKSVDIKTYGFNKVLEPLLRDVKVLEDFGVYVPLLGKCLKGTVHCVVADNLGAHGIAGFVENFSGEYCCRFCTAKRAETQSVPFTSGTFSLRTKDSYASHVKTALETNVHCCGVKRECFLTKSLSFFHVVSGYPPDAAHDLLEGIVPVELAYCLGSMISKKLFTLHDLNQAILSFPYKWSDKTNKPHALPQNITARKTIGGNVHENWCLIRLLPFLIGSVVPNDEPAWLVLMDLKDIVELVFGPVHTDESISYLQSKIIEHRTRYKALFPDVQLLPKHHLVEHYPVLIRNFGPLGTLWTLRFESKHSFFKRVVKHTNCFKNVPLTLASKHQFMLAFHMTSPSYGKSTLDVPHVSTVPVSVLKEDVAQAFLAKFPNASVVRLTKRACSSGIHYEKGMIVTYGSISGLTEFAEVIEMCVENEELLLFVKLLCGWYNDHYRAFELSLSPARELKLVAITDLCDPYPLADYFVGSNRMVTLKRHILIKG
ncbi:uncharacterized protein LOC134441029 isoform X1 [Engraulis encrasicolus]|uniref:uncharacterized protein LOC134441029 isoform X1 n=1 Tax=Engraulis encrasicolus TaxID=184585 RepID=UPI002FD37DB6